MVALLISAGIVAAFHVGKVPPALPSLRAETGATLSQGGWLLSLVNLTTAIAGMTIALTADRVGQRRLIILGTAACTLASLIGAFLDRIEPMLVARFLEGLGFITCTVAIPPLLLRLAGPTDSRRAMTFWSLYMPAGAGTMMLFAALILPFASWRVVWLVAAALSGLMLVALLLRASPRQELDALPAPNRHLLGEMVEVATSGGPLAIAVCFGAYSAVWFTIVGFLPTLQTERLGLTQSTAAIVTAVVAFVNVGGNLLSGALLQRGVPRVAILVGVTVSMAFCAAGVFLDGVPDLLRLFLAGLYSMLIGAVPGALFTAIPVHAPRPQLTGATTGLLMQGSAIGSVLGPPVTAALVSGGGWPQAVWMTSAGLGVAAAAGVFLHLRERRRISP